LKSSFGNIFIYLYQLIGKAASSASQTKALTSVGVMILKERGLINLTDPVSKYIPSFKNTTVLVVNEDKSLSVEPAVREITVHDLLTHSSGIGYGGVQIK
jgi:CubicO group peptidase (beta-lactamase class C family)